MHALAVVQGYSTFWFGKGHTGYKSFYHLPLQLGFDRFAGFLGGGVHTTARKRPGSLRRSEHGCACKRRCSSGWAA